MMTSNIVMTSNMYWAGSIKCIWMTSKMYLDNFEDVQRKESRRCSEEGVTKMFRERIQKDVHRKD
eukprot:12209943-Karenia_brevis.AAC.1